MAAGVAKEVVHAKRTYPSAEEMIDKEGKNMDAVFIATDAASHADLVLRAILVPGHKVCVDVATALNTTVSGVYAHLSAMKGGETLKIPVFSL